MTILTLLTFWPRGIWSNLLVCPVHRTPLTWRRTRRGRMRSERWSWPGRRRSPGVLPKPNSRDSTISKHTWSRYVTYLHVAFICGLQLSINWQVTDNSSVATACIVMHAWLWSPLRMARYKIAMQGSEQSSFVIAMRCRVPVCVIQHWLLLLAGPWSCLIWTLNY